MDVAPGVWKMVYKLIHNCWYNYPMFGLCVTGIGDPVKPLGYLPQRATKILGDPHDGCLMVLSIPGNCSNTNH